MAVETEKVWPPSATKSSSYLLPAIAGLVLSGVTILLSTKVLLLIAGVAGLVTLFVVPGSIFYAVLLIIPVNVELGGVLTVTRVVLLAALLAWIFNALTHRAPWPRVFHWPDGVFAFAFFLCVLVSALVNSNPGLLQQLGPFFIYAVIFYSTLTFVRTEEDLRRALHVLVFIALLEAILVLFEVYFNFVPFGGLHQEIADERGEATRAVGTAGHPIWLSGFFLITLPVTVFLALSTRRRWLTLLLIPVTGVQVLAWWFTYSRSGMISMASILFAVLLVSSKGGRFLATMVGIAVLSVLINYEFSLVSLISDISETDIFRKIEKSASVSAAIESFRWREENWAMGWNIFRDNVLFGAGLESPASTLLAYLPTDATAHTYIAPAPPHNQFITVAADSGIFTLFFFISLWVWALMCTKKAMACPELRLYGILFFIILVAQLTHFTFNPFSRDIWLTLALSASLGRMAALK